MFIEFLEHRQLLASTLVPVAIDARHLARVGSQVYVARPRSGGISEVIVYEGAATQTRRVGVVEQFSSFSTFTEINGQLLFNGAIRRGEGELLRLSNGTSEGTAPIAAERTLGAGFDPMQVVKLGAFSYALTLDPENRSVGRLMRWRDTMGAAEEVARITGFNPGADTPRVQQLTSAGGRLYFFAGDLFTIRPDVNVTLWTSDGTSAGTQALRSFDAVEISGQSALSWQVYEQSANGANVPGRPFYFAADDGANGMELWKTDGTPDGTVRVTQLGPGSQSSNPIGLGFVNDRLVFLDTTSPPHRGVYATDGTAGGTVKLADASGIGPNPEGAGAEALVIDGTMFFVGNENELWTTDGTAANTKKIHDGDRLGQFVRFRNQLYFVGFDEFGVQQVYRSDGTTTDRAIKFTNGRTEDSSLHSMFVIGRSLYVLDDPLFFGFATLFRLSDARISISGVAFEDADADGFRDPRVDSPRPGATIFLDDNENGMLDDGEPTSVTDSKGRWAFDDLANGRYYPRQLLDDGRWQTSRELGEIPVLEGDHVIVDFGSTTGAVLVGRVQQDLQGDKRLASSDPGVAAVNVLLDLNDNGQRDRGERIATTDDIGRYVFRDLEPGDYTVRMVRNDLWLNTTSQRFTGTAAEANTTITRSFGLTLPGVITGVVEDIDNLVRIRTPVRLFLDRDNDGALDADEPTTTSNSLGRFRFDGPSVRAGRQTILVVPGQGLHEDALTNSGNVLDLDRGERVEGLFLGLTRRSQIAGTVFFDFDHDNIFDPDTDANLSDSEVTVWFDLNDDGVRDSGEPVAADPGGDEYVFDEVEDDTEFIIRIALKGVAQGRPITSPNPPRYVVLVEEGEIAAHRDFAIEPQT